MSDLKPIQITATYKSGREENHYVKATKGPSNKKFDKLLRDLRNVPTVVDIKIHNPNREARL